MGDATTPSAHCPRRCFRIGCSDSKAGLFETLMRTVWVQVLRPVAQCATAALRAPAAVGWLAALHALAELWLATEWAQRWVRTRLALMQGRRARRHQAPYAPARQPNPCHPIADRGDARALRSGEATYLCSSPSASPVPSSQLRHAGAALRVLRAYGWLHIPVPGQGKPLSLLLVASCPAPSQLFQLGRR